MISDFMNPLITFGATFQTDSISWKLQTAGRRLGEWVEYQLYRLQSSDNPESQQSVYWPEWFLALLPLLRRIVFWTIVTALVVWAAWMLYIILRPYLREMRSHRYSVQNTHSSSELRRSPQQWLQQAQALQKQKRYAEACRAFYLGMVQQLQDKKLSPRRDSATDGDYRQIVQNLPKANACGVLIETHEQTIFGNITASEQMAQQCQDAYREILDP